MAALEETQYNSTIQGSAQQLAPPYFLLGLHRIISRLHLVSIEALLRLIYTLRFVGPICRPRQIGERISACEWRSDARATPIRQAGRFRKICDCLTDFGVSGPILRTKTQTAKELAQNKLYIYGI